MRSITNFKPEQIMELQRHEPMDVPRKDISFNILQIGAGGTGGYVVPYLARFLYMAQIRDQDLAVHYSIADADIVEEKNILRQNFIPSDVGHPKADVLARRYSRAFGIEIDTYEEMMDQSTLDGIFNNMMGRNGRRHNINIILGCVDNNEARRHFHKWIESKNISSTMTEYYWIDSGNEKTDGQVIVGSMTSGSRLPAVTDIYQDILNANHDPRETVSCDDRLMEDEQTMFVNAQAAIYMLNFVRKILLQETISVHGIDFDISCKASPRFLLEGDLPANPEIIMASDVKPVEEPKTIEVHENDPSAIDVMSAALNGRPLTGTFTVEGPALQNLDISGDYFFVGREDQLNLDELDEGNVYQGNDGLMYIRHNGENVFLGGIEADEEETEEVFNFNDNGVWERVG